MHSRGFQSKTTLWDFTINNFSVALRSLDLCLVEVNRIAPYYIGLKQNWRNAGVLLGTSRYNPK